MTLHKNMFSPRSKPKVAAMADTVCRTSDSTDSELDEEDPRPFLFFSHHVCGPCGSAFDPVCGPPWQQSEHLHKVTCPLVTVTRPQTQSPGIEQEQRTTVTAEIGPSLWTALGSFA